MKSKLVYILPIYNRNTDTHFRHLYDMINALSKKFDVYVLVENGKKFDQGNVAGSSLLPKNKLLRFIFCFFYLFKLRLSGYHKVYVQYSYLGVIAARLCGYKIFYWHCGQYWLFPGFINNSLLKLILHLADYLVTGTKFMAKGYSQHYNLSLDRIKVVPNWIKITNWQKIDSGEGEELRKKMHVSSEDKVILFVHRLAERKGAHYLPVIWKKFENNQRVHFVIAGNGPLIDELREKREMLDNKNNIHILGSVANSDLAVYMQSSDILIMPSEEEGFPRVAIESMACGLPIIGFDTGGLDEILPPHNLQYFYKIGDIDKLSDGLNDLLTKDLSIWSDEAKNKAANYDLNKVAEIFIDLLAK
ncbi:MAG: glycosyltransferase family 4 protein [Patescibacteria group bacterium]|nr:glycosyltransferase family 4 protein [Patescibacteria group bacterium]MDD4611076.1 glycosyltransferase family 4 protein [Patescibacteria group bacterium]